MNVGSRARGRGVYDANGAVVGMLGVVQDITEQVRTRETLRVQAEAVRESEERYRAFIENSSEGIWRLEFNPPIDTSLPVEEQVAAAYANGRLRRVQRRSWRTCIACTRLRISSARRWTSCCRRPIQRPERIWRRSSSGIPRLRRRIQRARRRGQRQVLLEQHDRRRHRQAPAPDVGVAARC